MSYRTPGVYVEEIATLPPSVAQGATAVPAFIGYTEKGPSEPTVIDTFLEYQNVFGGPQPTTFTVDTTANPFGITSGATNGIPGFLLYYAVSHYFKNGGGRCYVVSTGNYGSAPAKADLLAGLGLVEKEDEPTILVIPDAVKLTVEGAFGEVCTTAIAQCDKLGDRFAVLDVPGGDVEAFREAVGTSSLKYAAAYHPYLATSLNHVYDESAVTVTSATSTWSREQGANGVVVSFSGPDGDAPTVQLTIGTTDPIEFAVTGRDLLIKNVGDKTGADTATAFATWAASNDAGGFAVEVNGDGTGNPDTTGASKVSLTADASGSSSKLADLKEGPDANTAVYNAVKTALSAELVTLPPSAAMAGIYARVDRQRGVWKAPANESVSAVIKPTEKISHEDQEGLNVDPNAGKSINAIRQFAGKGTLVWGARTLAGNDNEWRYVPVRRLFSVIEESTKKASSFAVFEPNDATTWLKVKGMIEAYLYGLWEQGALAGPSPDAAYFVNVGLGKTMTAQDVLEGRMIVEIGIAAVRPAEFIIIRFSHKIQEA